MVPESPLRSAVGIELPNDGTATGDHCEVCRRRFTVMHYIVGRRLCGECLYKEHVAAAKAGRI